MDSNHDGPANKIEKLHVIENGDSKKEETENNPKAVVGDIVTPWDVRASSAKGVDYNTLCEKFGCSSFCDDAGAALIAKFETLTGQRAHHLLRRRLFYAHRDFDTLLELYARGKPFYLYTGRGPSSESAHLGHLLPFMFTRYLQKVFNVPLVIQVTDDEKFLYKPDLTLKMTQSYAKENIKDIVAVGFDPSNTFIFTNTRYICEEPAFYPNILQLLKCVNVNRAEKIFGITASDPIGKMFFPAVEAAPCLSSSFPRIFNGRSDITCLVPAAIDQDPFFRMMRDEAPKLNAPKPVSIYGQFLPSLRGADGKMSSSDDYSCIAISDSPQVVEQKIKKSYSGGQETMELHRQLGGDPDSDVAYQILRFFLEDDDKLEEVRQKYVTGEMASGEMKRLAINTVQPLLAELQQRRAGITDEHVEEFMKVRKLGFDY